MELQKLVTDSEERPSSITKISDSISPCLKPPVLIMPATLNMQNFDLQLYKLFSFRHRQKQVTNPKEKEYHHTSRISRSFSSIKCFPCRLIQLVLLSNNKEMKLITI